MSVSLSIRPVTDLVIEEAKENPVKLFILLRGGIADDMIEEEQDDYEYAYHVELTDKDKKLFVNWKPDFLSESHSVKYFKVIHYLLSGQIEWRTGSFPHNFLLGKRIEMGETGWGKANFFTSSDVREINKAISIISDNVFAEKHKTEIVNSSSFPESKWKEDDTESVVIDFNHLKESILSFTKRSLGMFVTLS